MLQEGEGALGIILEGILWLLSLDNSIQMDYLGKCSHINDTDEVMMYDTLHDLFYPPPILSIYQGLGGNSRDQVCSLKVLHDLPLRHQRIVVRKIRRPQFARHQIIEASKLAASFGIAPKVWESIAGRGLLLSEFIYGSPLRSLEGANIGNFLQKLKIFHASLREMSLQIPPHLKGDDIVYFERIKLPSSQKVLVNRSFALRSKNRFRELYKMGKFKKHLPLKHYDLLLKRLVDAFEFPKKIALIHGDLKLEHLIQDVNTGNIVAIDWGEAGVGHPFEDLGRLSSYAQLSKNQDQELLRLYLGYDPSSYEQKMFDIAKSLSILHDLGWSARRFFEIDASAKLQCEAKESDQSSAKAETLEFYRKSFCQAKSRFDTLYKERLKKYLDGTF